MKLRRHRQIALTQTNRRKGERGRFRDNYQVAVLFVTTYILKA
jgi:hypothetical protein